MIFKNLIKKRVAFVAILLMALFFCGFGFEVASAQFSQPADLGLDFAQGTGLTTTDIRVTIARIIRIAFGLLGIVAVVIILYGGATWMLSKGDQGQIDKAKKIIINGVIGLVIILSAFGITEFILRTIQGQSSGGGVNISGPGAGPGSGFGGGALGRAIRAHYPDRDAVDVPRNAKVIITFNEKINNDTIFDSATNKINFNNVKIYKSSDAAQGGGSAAEANLIKDINVATVDQLTYSFRFTNLIGSPSENIKYTVYLEPGIQKTNGSSIFDITGSYYWDFTTSTTIDLDPPKIDSVSPVNPVGCPADVDKCNPRNKLIQINFNEAVDPTTVSGVVPGFSFITTGQNVPGEYVITNQYRTVVFTPIAACEGVTQNSCGEKVYCLPAKTKFDMNILAAQLDVAQGNNQAAFPYTGVVDVAGNSLDGDGDGKADGPVKDSYKWSFNTSGNIDLTPPTIKRITPDVNTSKVPLNQNVTIEFNEQILGTSLYGSAEVLYGTLKDKKRDRWNDAQVVEFALDAQNKVDPTKVLWRHYGQLMPSDGKNTYAYYPVIYSTIKDDAQNCFNPNEGPTSGIKQCEKLGNNWKGGTAYGIYPNCDLTK